jgi:hypothetical protein
MAKQEREYTAPQAFISYSWDDEAHKEWVKQLATRLRAEDGVDVTLDQWHAAPGDQIPAFMEGAVRENDFVIAVCTPQFKARSDRRGGGVGYEGDIMTAYVLNSGTNKKFIPVLRRGSWEKAAPMWLLGRAYIDLRGDPYSQSQYEELLRTLHDAREVPPIGRRPDFGSHERSETGSSSPPTAPTEGPRTPKHQSPITSLTTVQFHAKIPKSILESMTSRARAESKFVTSLITDALLAAIAGHSTGFAPLPPDFYAKYRPEADIQVQPASESAARGARQVADKFVFFNIRMHIYLHELLVSWAHQDKVSLNALIVGILERDSGTSGS